MSNIRVTQLKGAETVPLGLKVSVGESLRPAIQKIVRELDPQKVVLFGSYAYGNPNSHSDVDLLVIMESDQPHKERSWAVSRLLLPRPFPVDILVKTPEEVDEALESGDFFLEEILSRGVVLYERS